MYGYSKHDVKYQDDKRHWIPCRSMGWKFGQLGGLRYVPLHQFEG